MKKEQRVWLMGVPSHGQEVIKTLQKLGGENVYGLDGEREDSIYFINHEGIISSTIKDETGRLIMDFYREIKLPIQWKDGDVLVNVKFKDCFVVCTSACDSLGRIYHCYMYADGENEEINTEGGTILRSAYRLATPSELEHFHEIMHKFGKDWDAEKKQVVDWRWEPKDDESYYCIDNDGDIMHDTWDGFLVDNNRYNFGNCFRTREEAEAALVRVKKALKGGEK